MNYRFSPSDVFKYPFKNDLYYQSSIPGPRDIGFKLTNNGNYDIENRRLGNVNKPENYKDVVIYSMFVKSMYKLIKDLADFDNRLESLSTDNDDRG